MSMFKKKKRSQSKRIIVEDDEISRNKVISMSSNSIFVANNINGIFQAGARVQFSRNMKKLVDNDEEEEDIFNSLGLNKKRILKKGKKKVKIFNYEDEEEENCKPIFKAKKKKSMANSAAVASVYTVKITKEDNFKTQEGGPKYSVVEIEQLKDSQYKSNKEASEHIQKYENKDSTDAQMSDEELLNLKMEKSEGTDFTTEEKDRMKKIIDIRHKKMLAQDGVAMNTKKEEFLAPFEVCKAEEDIDNLKESIEDNELYTMNTNKNEGILEDFGDSESWINNQIQSALGAGTHEPDQEMLEIYKEDRMEPTLPDTSEMRSIKYSMGKSIKDYTDNLEYEAKILENSIEKNQEMLGTIEKGIISHEKDIVESSNIIGENTGNFKLLMEFSGIMEDLSCLLDEKEEEINIIFEKLKEVEIKYLEDLSNIAVDIGCVSMFPKRKAGLGFKSKPKQGNGVTNSKKILENEHLKNIEAAQSALKDILKNVKEDYSSPVLLLNLMKEIYSKYTKEEGFPFNFDVRDMVDFLTPYLKIDLIQNYSLNQSKGSISSLTDSKLMKMYIFMNSCTYFKFVTD